MKRRKADRKKRGGALQSTKIVLGHDKQEVEVAQVIRDLVADGAAETTSRLTFGRPVVVDAAELKRKRFTHISHCYDW